MSKTITEKIFEEHLGKPVHSGELVFVEVDKGMGTDATMPLAIQEFEKMGKPVHSPEKLVVIQDHFVPAKDILSANYSKIVREFSKKNKIENYYEIGKGGICHHIMLDEGICLPGSIIAGADSHTCTYGAVGAFATGVGSTDLAAFMATGKIWFKIPEVIKIVIEGEKKLYIQGKDIILNLIKLLGVAGATYKAIEFVDRSKKKLPMSDRITICNMAIECGAKTGIFEYDEITEQYYSQLNISIPKEKKYKAGEDKEYDRVIKLNLDELELSVAEPYLPSNVKAVSGLEKIHIDQAFIGSCTNGRIEDMRVAAGILKGKKIHEDVRMVVIPGTQKILSMMCQEGITDIFVEAGASVTSPTCGPCLGGHYGIIGVGEVCISTSNRNFVGRMGDVKGKVYLANPAVVAASAVKGYICVPEGGESC